MIIKINEDKEMNITAMHVHVPHYPGRVFLGMIAFTIIQFVLIVHLVIR